MKAQEQIIIEWTTQAMQDHIQPLFTKRQTVPIIPTLTGQIDRKYKEKSKLWVRVNDTSLTEAYSKIYDEDVNKYDASLCIIIDMIDNAKRGQKDINILKYVENIRGLFHLPFKKPQFPTQEIYDDEGTCLTMENIFFKEVEYAYDGEWKMRADIHFLCTYLFSTKIEQSGYNVEKTTP